MRWISPLVVLVALASAAQPAAAEDPHLTFRIEMERVVAEVDCATKRVTDALEREDWAGWCNAHQAYTRILERNVAAVESAMTRYLFGVLNSGESLAGPAQNALDAAGDLAGMFTKRKVTAHAYASLTRQGVAPARRKAALGLLLKQGVYSASGRPVGRRPPPGANVNPLCGRVPGTPEASEALRKWQYAVLRLTSSSTELKRLEDQLAGMQVHNPSRAELEQEVAGAKREHQELLNAVEEWKAKYFAAGGR